MHITKENYASATGVSDVTVWRRLKDVPFRVPRKRSEKLYPLAAVLPTLRDKEIEAGAVERLTHAAVPLSRDLYVSAQELTLAKAFSDWLPAKEMQNRASEMMNAFVDSIANSPLCSAPIVRNMPKLQNLFLLAPQTAKYVILGERAPDVSNLGPAFAVQSNSFELEEVAA